MTLAVMSNAPALPKAVVPPQKPVDFDEGCAVDHRANRDDAAGEQAEPGRSQRADRPFSENSEPLLNPFVMGKAGPKYLQALGCAVEIGKQVNADLVGEQRVEPFGRNGSIARYHQPVPETRRPNTSSRTSILGTKPGSITWYWLTRARAAVATSWASWTAGGARLG
jgi:hypothetical protein